MYNLSHHLSEHNLSLKKYTKYLKYKNNFINYKYGGSYEKTQHI